jgi:hypothetical protein
MLCLYFLSISMLPPSLHFPVYSVESIANSPSPTQAFILLHAKGRATPSIVLVVRLKQLLLRRKRQANAFAIKFLPQSRMRCGSNRCDIWDHDAE